MTLGQRQRAAKIAEYQAAYRRRHPERVAAARKLARKKEMADPLKLERRRSWDRKRQNDAGRESSRRTYYLKNREKIILRSAKTRLKRLYGISFEQYQEILERQAHLCALCGLPPDGIFMLAVDHDHATGAIRGLIHQNCNLGLGNFYHSPERLRLAAEYLERCQQPRH